MSVQPTFETDTQIDAYGDDFGYHPDLNSMDTSAITPTAHNEVCFLCLLNNRCQFSQPSRPIELMYMWVLK